LAGKNKYFWHHLCEGAELQKLQFPGDESCKHQGTALSLRIRILQPSILPYFLCSPSGGLLKHPGGEIAANISKGLQHTIVFEVKKKIIVTMSICLWPDIHFMELTVL